MHRVLRRAITLVVFLALFAATVPSPAAAAGGWKYTALGDSIGTGLFAFKGYVPRYRDYAAADTGVSVSLTNLSQNGWTSTDLLNALKTNSTFRSSVQGSQIVTWDIGGNDLRAARDSYKGGTCGGADNQDCLRATIKSLESNWDGIAAEILTLRPISSTIIRTMDIYNPYVNTDKAADSWHDDNGDLVDDGPGGPTDFVIFKTYLDQVNTYIAGTRTRFGIPVAGVYAAFNGPDGTADPSDSPRRYITFDGLHPNDTGHKVIADLLRGLRYAPLSSR